MKYIQIFSIISAVSICLSCKPKPKEVKVVFNINPMLSVEQKLKQIKDNYPNRNQCDINIDTRAFKIANEGVAPVSKDTLQKAIKSYNLLNANLGAIQTPFIIKADLQTEPMKTINANLSNFQAIYIGFGKVGPNPIGLNATIYLTLMKVDLIETPDSTQEKMSYFLENNQKVIFRCTNLQSGTWQRISESEMNTLKSNLALSAQKTKGYAFGINNFLGNSAIDKYIYLANKNNNLHLIFTNELLKESKSIDEQGHVDFVISNNPSSKKCTFGTHIMPSKYPKNKFIIKACDADAIFKLNASCIRPCPQYCPD